MKIGFKHSKETRKRLVLALRARWKDPEQRAKLLASRKVQGFKPENNEKLVAGAKRAWARKSYRRKVMKTRRRTMYSNPVWKRKVNAHKYGSHSWNAGHTKETHPTLARFSRNNIGTIPNWAGYEAWYRSKKKSIRMRSSWEVKFAKWCDAQGTKWKYEPRWFNVGKGRWRGVSYTPDFYLPKTKQWVEIKGYLTKSNERKIVAFKTQHPKLSWVMYQFKELKAMGVL